MAITIIRIILLAIFVAHFAVPEKVSSVSLESAPFSDPSMACGYRATNNG